MKILISALSGIGDALIFSPSLSLLKKKIPDCEIDMLVMFKQVAELYQNNPNINRIHLIDFLNQPKIKSFRGVMQLRKLKYDCSINVYPSNRKEYNLISYLIGAKRRIATRYNHYSFSNLHFLNTDLANESKNRHNALQNLDLIKKLIPDIKDEDAGNYEVYITGDDRNYAVDILKIFEKDYKFLFGFHAGSAVFKGHINKRWDADKFAQLAILLNKKYNAGILIFGTEKDVNETISNSSREITFLPFVTTLNQTLAFMEKCRLFVTNDSALMHLASALNIPTAAIFGYTNYKELHPWKSNHLVIRKEFECSPCFFNSPKSVKCIYKGVDMFKCIKTISVEEVFETCRMLIETK